jgi:hypothetical protein
LKGKSGTSRPPELQRPNVGEVADLFEALHGGRGRVGAYGDDGAADPQAPAIHCHEVGSLEACLVGKDVDAEPAEALRAVVLACLSYDPSIRSITAGKSTSGPPLLIACSSECLTRGATRALFTRVFVGTHPR